MRASIKVAIIDDEARTLRSLARLMRSAGIEAITFSSPYEFLNNSAREEVDCAVTDLRMPGIDGLKLQQELKETSPHLSLVFITGHGNVPAGVTAMKGGAVDFLEKPADGDELIEALGRAAARSREQILRLEALQDLRQRHATLTPRERQVFVLIASGLINKEAAWELGISEKTIKVHRARVVEKMQARSLPDLVRMAGRLGISAEAAAGHARAPAGTR